MSECIICGRSLKGDKFCEYHEAANDSLISAFDKWKSSAGLTWTEFLDKISELENTGRWVIEVVNYIKSQDDS